MIYFRELGIAAQVDLAQQVERQLQGYLPRQHSWQDILHALLDLNSGLTSAANPTLVPDNLVALLHALRAK